MTRLRARSSTWATSPKPAGRRGQNAISQGKSHVSFWEAKGKLYFTTHLGFYSIIDGMEKPGIPPAGMKKYPGGHFLAYDLATGKYEDFRRGAAQRRHHHLRHGPRPHAPLRHHLAHRALHPL